jgi:hypothetical protein
MPDDLDVTLVLKMSETNIVIDALAAREHGINRLMNKIVDQGNAQLMKPVDGWEAKKEMSNASNGVTEKKPAITEDDSQADLDGVPRKDNPTVEA